MTFQSFSSSQSCSRSCSDGRVDPDDDGSLGNTHADNCNSSNTSPKSAVAIRSICKLQCKYSRQKRSDCPDGEQCRRRNKHKKKLKSPSRKESMNEEGHTGYCHRIGSDGLGESRYHPRRSTPRHNL